MDDTSNSISSMEDLKLQIEENILTLIDQLTSIHCDIDRREQCIQNVKLIHDAFYSGKGLRKINIQFIPMIIQLLKQIGWKFATGVSREGEYTFDKLTNKCIELTKDLSNLISRYIIANDAEKTKILNLELELERLRNENHKINQRMIMDAAEVSPNKVPNVEPSAPELEEGEKVVLYEQL